MTSLTFYDGAGCIGGNKILLESRGSGIFFDFGLNFGEEGKYFDEFLSARTILGLADPLDLELMPPLRGLYREDLCIPNLWDRYCGHPHCREVTVEAVFLSHAHVDHTGYISYIRYDLPIYASRTTSFLIKAMQDTKGGSIFQEACYVTPREIDEQNLLRSPHYQRVPYQQRPFVLVDCDVASEAAHAFWGRTDGGRALSSVPFQTCKFKGQTSLGLKFIAWPVDHSIPGASAFAVETPEGWVVYTGDLRLHGKNAGLTRNFMEEAGKLAAKVLICEGTHPDTTKPTTEQEVELNCFDVVRKAAGRPVIADFGPRNIERLLSFLNIAKETGRRLVLTSKDLYLLEALYFAGEPDVPDPFTDSTFTLYDKPRGTTGKWEKALWERFAAVAPERIYTPGSIGQDLGDLILCLSYYDFHALLDIKPYNAVYIYSSSEAYDEDMMLDHNRIRNWLQFFNMEVFGALGPDRENSGFHASGHIHGPGLEELIATIRPEILIPVHTTSTTFFERFKDSCQVIYPIKNTTYNI